MKIQSSSILITGASGGIGSELARELARKGARLLISGRNAAALTRLCEELRAVGANITALPADLASDDGPQRLSQAAQSCGAPDIVIHCAGSMSFGAFEQETIEGIDQLWRTNVIAPMQLTRALLPALKARGSGRVVFVGSIFGSIAFPLYAGYSATKYALRGFSEALRRELEGSGVGITYVAPRYTRTALNNGAPARIAEATNMAQDDPTLVARRIVDAIERDAAELYFGSAERIFTLINAWFPRLIDRALRKQTEGMRAFDKPVSLTR